MAPLCTPCANFARQVISRNVRAGVGWGAGRPRVVVLRGAAPNGASDEQPASASARTLLMQIEITRMRTFNSVSIRF